VQLGCARLEAILVTDVNTNAVVPAKVPDVPVNEHERCTGGELGDYIRLENAVLHG